MTKKASMYTRFSAQSCAILLSGFFGCAELSAETQGYVVSHFHTATYAHEENCPKGGNGGTKERDLRSLEQLGYSREEAMAKLLTIDIPLLKGFDVIAEMIYRGKKDGMPANIYLYPDSAEDYGLELVSGPYAFGFDLDGKGGGFEDPETGDKGVDNELFRALGCFTAYDRRLPDRPVYEDVVWNFQVDVMPALLLTLEGEDLSEDGPVTIKLYKAVEHLRRNVAGGPLHDATYRIDPNPRTFGELKGRIEGGVLITESQGAPVMWEGELPTFSKIQFENAQLRLSFNRNGSTDGWMGGYQPWMDFLTLHSVPGEFSATSDVSGIYHNLKKLADADPDPETGQNRAISATYRIELAPVYIADWEGKLLEGTLLSAEDRPVQKNSVASLNETRSAH